MAELRGYHIYTNAFLIQHYKDCMMTSLLLLLEVVFTISVSCEFVLDLNVFTRFQVSGSFDFTCVFFMKIAHSPILVIAYISGTLVICIIPVISKKGGKFAGHEIVLPQRSEREMD